MALLEHSSDIDHGVDISCCRRVSAHWRLGRVGKKFAQPSHTRGARRGSLRISKGENAPTAVGFARISKANRFGVCETNDRCRMEPHANHQAFGQMLMTGFGGDERRFVLGRRSRSIMSVLDEISLH